MRGNCACCGGEYSINADGTIRYHLTDKPECQEGPDSRKCKGVGKSPAGAEPEVAGQLSFLCRVPSGPTGCGHQVHLTANHRARSHLTPHGEKCTEGSSAPPIAVGPEGFREDTADWTDERWAEMLPKPQPPGPGTRPAAAPEDLRFGSDDPVADFLGTGGPTPAERAAKAGDGRTAAQQAERGPAVADPVGSALIGLMGAEVGQPGTVLDRMTDDQFAAAVTRAENPSVDPATAPSGLGDVFARDADNRTITPRDPATAIKALPPDERGPAEAALPERARCTVGELDEGLLFRRHTRPEPVGSLVFRVQKVHPQAIESIVVSAGPYGGRHGMLTDLTEEITCTDLDGAPRARRASGLAAQRPTWKPQQPSSKAEATPAPATPPTSSTSGPAPGSKPSTKATAPAATSTTSSPETASGPTDSAGTSTRTAPMTTDAQAAGDFLAAGSGSYGEAEARYGRWGRYKLTHPATGKTVEWTRATTFAKSISDTYTLSQWAQRNVLVGATMRPDIVAAAHGKDVSKDREQLNTWTEELQQAAGSKVAANLGTAVHSFTEAVDRRWAERWKVLREETPQEFQPHVEAYILLLEEHGLEPVPHMIEFSTGVLQYEVMGTSDNCYRATKHLVLKMPRGEVRLSPGEHVIGDKKTGKDLDYGWQEICIQLALYAQGVNTQGIFNWADLTWDPDPLSRFAEPGTKVREDVGVILHLPVDPRSPKKPGLHGVDLESGWNAAVLCERVRVWRKLRNLAGPVAVVDADPLAEGSPQAAEAPRAATRPPTLRERAEAVTSKTEASRVYQDAVAARVPVSEAKELIAIMSERIARIAEPGGAKV